MTEREIASVAGPENGRAATTLAINGGQRGRNPNHGPAKAQRAEARVQRTTEAMDVPEAT